MTENEPTGKRWFYIVEGKRQGPVEAGRIVDLVLAGELSEDTLVWHAGLPEWLPARRVDVIKHELPPPLPGATRAPLPDPLDDEDDDAEDDEVAPEGESVPATGGGSASPGETAADGQRRRRLRKRKRRAAASRFKSPWLVPLILVLIGLMIGLWWLLLLMNEVPPGRIIQTGDRAPGAGAYRVAEGREPRVSSRVTSSPPRLTTTFTWSPGLYSPSA
jgi:hypothetical protein